MLKEDYKIALDNYIYGVRRVIPGHLTGKFLDQEALADELALVLHARDVLEEGMADLQAENGDCLRQVDEADRLLLLSKDALLANAPYYTSLRRGKETSPDRWWYYLDKVSRSLIDSYWISITEPPKKGLRQTIILPQRVPVRQFFTA